HDGRQPRQLHRQPRAVGGGLRAAAEHHRPRPDHLLLHCRGPARLGDLGLAVVDTLEPSVHICAMNDDTADILSATVAPDAGAEVLPARKKARKKRAKSSGKAAAKAVTSAIEVRIGHKFADPNLLVTAMTHVSALKPSRKRGESYQRLEFL